MRRQHHERHGDQRFRQHRQYAGYCAQRGGTRDGGQSAGAVAGNGAVSLNAATGGVYAQFDSAVSTGQLTLSAAAWSDIRLATASGDITVDDTSGLNANTADDDLTLVSAGGIAFSGGTLTAASITLNAATTISRSGVAAVDLDTSAASGTIALTGPGGIGAAGDSIKLQAGNGVVRPMRAAATFISIRPAH